MRMIVEYYATEEQDEQMSVLLKGYDIIEWFNPEDDYYVLETHDARVLTIMCLFDIEIYICKDDLPRDYQDQPDSNSDNS